MTKPAIQTTAVILSKKLHTENTIQYTFFSKEYGLMTVFERLSKQSKKIYPDVFDYAECLLTPFGSQDLYFIKEYRLLKRYDAIGASYANLLYASQAMQLFIKNLFHAESFTDLFDMCLKLLCAFSDTKQPELIYLKALYSFTRMEGYPTKEHWLCSLPEEIQQEARLVLFQPSHNYFLDTSKIQYLIRNLKQWTERNTPIIVSI